MSDASPSPKPRAWRGSGSRAANGNPTARRRKAVLVLYLMLALAGALAAFLLYPRTPPRPSFVAIVIDQYHEADANGIPRLPASAWAENDREALAMLGWKGHSAFDSQERKLLTQELRELGRDQNPDQPLVIYLCAYAAVTEAGELALLPADARLDDEATWLPLREVFDHIKNCRIKHKLLLLDLMKPLTDARAGLLSAEVADPLQPVLEEALKTDSGLQVLCASEPGQVSYASEDLGHTAFVHYLIEGLAGRADGELEGKTADGVVSVQELAAYVTRRVNGWAWRNRGAAQMPKLHGGGNDYALTLAEKQRSADEAALAKGYPEFLAKGWELHDRWRKDPSGHAPPDLTRQLETVLLRGEEQWRGGESVGKVEEFVGPRLKRLEQARARRAGAVDRGPPHSLAEAVSRGDFKPPHEGLPDARRQLKELARLHALAKAPKATEKDAATFDAAAEEFRKKFTDKPTDLAWLVFQAAAAEDAPSQQALVCWISLLNPSSDLAEIRSLRQVAGQELLKPENWLAEAAALALRVSDTAEKVDVDKAPWLPWVASQDAIASRERQTGEQQFFAKDAASRALATQTLNRALRAYQKVNTALITLRDAQRTRDDSLTSLPGFAPYLDKNPTQVTVWVQAVRETRTLRDLLARPPESGGAEELVRQVGDRTTIVQDALKTLRQPLDPGRIQRWIDQSPKAVAADLQQMEALLRLPETSARDRLVLWNAYRTASGVLQEEPQTRGGGGLPAFDVNEARRQEQKLSLLRARVSLTLLQLDGANEAEGVTAALQKAEKAPQDAAAWQVLRQELRRAWKRHEAERGRPSAQ